MELHLLDHALAALLLIALPLYGRYEFRRLRRRLAAGETSARMHEYRWTIVLQWGLVAVLLGLWTWQGRGLATLGIAEPGGRWLWLGLALGMVAVFALVAQVMQLRDRPDGREEIEAQLGDLADILPRSPREMRGFSALSVTAGVCEELLFRGFLIAWLVSSSGLGEWPAMLLISVAFGIAHVYQGPSGMLKTGGVGAFLGVLYLLTGSLLVPIIIHALMDLLQGFAIYQVLREDVAPEDTTTTFDRALSASDAVSGRQVPGRSTGQGNGACA